MSRHRREALQCAGCRLWFSNMGAFNEHVVRPRGICGPTELRTWKPDVPGRCARESEMEEMPTVRKVAGVWFKSEKDV